MNEQQKAITLELSQVRYSIKTKLQLVMLDKGTRKEGEYHNIDATIIALQESLTALVRAESDIVSRYA